MDANMNRGNLIFIGYFFFNRIEEISEELSFSLGTWFWHRIKGIQKLNK